MVSRIDIFVQRFFWCVVRPLVVTRGQVNIQVRTDRQMARCEQSDMTVLYDLILTVPAGNGAVRHSVVFLFNPLGVRSYRKSRAVLYA